MTTNLAEALELERRVRISMSQYRTVGNGPGAVTVENVKPDDMQGVVNGCSWFGVDNGRAVFQPRMLPLPTPVPDQLLLPFWQAGNVVPYIRQFDKTSESPSLLIQHLCGYNYSPQNYKREAARLESYGFVCMRSQRGADGRFHESWYLPGKYSMRGDLEKEFATLEPQYPDSSMLWTMVVRWLCRHVSFGTLDVCCQRAAMVID